MFDTLIKGGTVVDGSGKPPRTADVAIREGKVVAIESIIDAPAKEVIEATGLVVAPGFVDVHTHYDGQVTWDEEMLPSVAHGVTTVVIGNCGIGFAPVRPGSEDRLISLMEGVEDIPGTALHEGIKWAWESYPEFLDYLGDRQYALDVASQVPHSAVRAYVMKERASTEDPPTTDELKEMARIVHEGLEAGAVGFGTSRIAMHQASDGSVVPGTTAAKDELLTIGHAMAQAGLGVFQIVPSGVGGNTRNSISTMGQRVDRWTLFEELEMIRQFAEETGRHVTFTFAQSRSLGEDTFDRVLDVLQGFADKGLPIHPQFSARPTGILTGFQAFHAFQRRPTYRRLAELPLDERVIQLSKPTTKAAILAESDIPTEATGPMENFHLVIAATLGDLYQLGDPPDYEPDPSTSVLARAQREGRDPFELLYDIMLEDEGRAVLMVIATNYISGDLSKTEELIRNPGITLGLGDGGAHVRAISDASIPTFLLSHWVRDRTRGSRLPIELVVKKQAHDTAALYGLNDRGMLETGRRADLNVIDMQSLRLGRPYIVDDLPAGGLRFLQDADGYVLTMVGGKVTRRNGHDTGARPGRLVRGPQSVLTTT